MLRCGAQHRPLTTSVDHKEAQHDLTVPYRTQGTGEEGRGQEGRSCEEGTGQEGCSLREMTQRRLAGTPLDFGALRTELGVPGEFSSAALDEAQRAAASANLPDLDRTDIEFITVDPAGSKDLDQAVHIAA